MSTFTDVEKAPQSGATLPTEQNWVGEAPPLTVGAPVMDVVIDGRRFIPADGLGAVAYLLKSEKKKKKKKCKRVGCVLFLLLLVITAICFAKGHGHRHGHEGKHGGKHGGRKGGRRGGAHMPPGGCSVKGEPEVDGSDLMFAIEIELHQAELEAIAAEDQTGQTVVLVEEGDEEDETPETAKASVQGRGGKGGKKGGKKGGRKTRAEICEIMTEKGAPAQKEGDSQELTDARAKVWGLKKAIACAAEAPDADAKAELRAAYSELRTIKKAAKADSSDE